MAGKAIEAGKLRHRLEIQSATEAQGASGELGQSWATVATRWASVEPLQGRELWQVQQAQAQTTHRVVLRYYAALTAKMRFLWGTRVLQIQSVLAAEEVQNRQECLCVESKPQ